MIPAHRIKFLKQPVLVIGNKTYTHEQVIHDLRVANMKACRILTKVLKQQGITTPLKLYHSSFTSVLGKSRWTTLYVATKLLHAHGYSWRKWIERRDTDRKKAA